MFTRAHHKHQAGPARPGRERGSAATPVSASYPDIPIDEAMLALDAEITGLAQLPVAQAAKERGWAALRRELDHRPVRISSPALLKGTGAKGSPGRASVSPVLVGHSRSWRVALGSAAAVVAIVATLLGTYAAGLLGGGESGGPVAEIRLGHPSDERIREPGQLARVPAIPLRVKLLAPRRREERLLLGR